MAGKQRGSKRREGRKRATERLRAFREGVDLYEKFLKNAYASEVQWRKTLLGVYELHPGDEAYALCGPTLLEALGVRGYEEIDFHANETDGYESLGRFESGRAGGSASWLVDSHGREKALVVMRRYSGEMPPTEESRAADIALFYHEIGHVDDFEKRVNFSADRELDLSALELYAHQFACKKLRQLGLKQPLGFYLADALPQLASSKVMPNRLAAQTFLADPAIAEYKDFAGHFYHNWLDQRSDQQ